MENGAWKERPILLSIGPGRGRGRGVSSGINTNVYMDNRRNNILSPGETLINVGDNWVEPMLSGQNGS
jgi:hypothetical protein